jgi:hypothetical protein
LLPSQHDEGIAINNADDREAFPAAKLPNGSWITDRELIRVWILARHRVAHDIPTEFFDE